MRLDQLNRDVFDVIGQFLRSHDVSSVRACNRSTRLLALNHHLVQRLRFLLVRNSIRHPLMLSTAKMLGGRRQLVDGHTPLERLICPKVMDLSLKYRRVLPRLRSVVTIFVGAGYDVNCVNRRGKSLLDMFDRACMIAQAVAVSGWYKNRTTKLERAWAEFRTFLTTMGFR